MKIQALLLAVCCAVPVAAMAQQPPPPPGGGMGGPPGPMGAAGQKMVQMHDAFRASVLGALTPEHKALLAKVVGDLAVSDQPDPKAAAAQLDAALSDGEKQAILAAQSKMEADMQAQMESMRSQWQSAHPDASPPAMRMRSHGSESPDPGRILLSLGGGNAMFFRGGGGPPGPP